MSKQAITVLTLVFISGCCSNLAAGPASDEDMIEAMKQSIVYLKTSFYGYEQRQPWKHKSLSQGWACGCAVGEYEVLTTAWNVADVAFIEALRYGQNEFIGAKIKVVDYESNLCLIELDSEAMSEPLRPLVFSEEYRKGDEVAFYWLSPGNHLYSGRGYLDRARVEQTNSSYEKRLHYVAANTSQRTGRGEVYCSGSEPIGIACWSNNNKEAGLIPAEAINRFLAEAGKDNYKGFGVVGFEVRRLLDPTMRSYLKMPDSVVGGVYVSDVYNLGSGSDVLKKSDVILAIDGKALNSYGRFEHSKYGRLYFDHLITSKSVGQEIVFDLWRNGKMTQVKAKARNFQTSEMLVPYHEYGKQPEYIITGGFILQKLTRPYLAAWGEDWPGKVSPHLYHYYRDLSFKPTDERSDIVILSYVLPANINLGYQDLRQLVVEKFNGQAVHSISDIVKAQAMPSESGYDVIEFELDNPVVVIDRKQLGQADALISRSYGINKLVNVNE